MVAWCGVASEMNGINMRSGVIDGPNYMINR